MRNRERKHQSLGRRWGKILRGTQGAQLLEFALGVPFLVVLLIGIFDFGGAFYLKQKLTNAARDGARIAISQSGADLTATSCSVTGVSSPCTVQAVRDAVVNYLGNAGLDTSMVATNPTKTGAMQWTYSSTANGNPMLVIDRSFPVFRTDGSLIVSTRVRVSYPYNWIFDQVARLLSPSANFSGSFMLSTEVVMENLT